MTDSRGITRRQVVSRALTAGVLGAGGSTAGSLIMPLRAGAIAGVETDAQLIYATLAVELLVIAVYERAIASGKLSVGNQILANQLLSFEREHARVLDRELTALGSGAPPSLAGAGASSLDAILAAKQVPESVAKIGSDADAMRLLIKVEEVAEGAYYKAISKLADPQLALRSAQIMASEAEHRTVLSEALDPGAIDQAVPVAFVQGRG